MSHPEKHALTRRTLLGGSAAAGAGAVLGSALPAVADAGAGAARLDQKAVDAVAARLDRDLIALRRRIHRHPEVSGEECRTAATVAHRLRSAGLSVTTGVGGHGVVAVLQGAHPGRTVAYRADMDALTPADQIGGGGTPAHLCGHDLHTTVGVGVGQVLARLRHRLSGRLVLFFQPAEETLTGARAMIAAGVLERTRPEEIHALHCGPFPVGRFAVTPGTGLPGQDRPVVTVSGLDAAKRLAAALDGLSTVAHPRTAADFERLVRDMQTPNGPLARFVSLRTRLGEPDAAGRVQVQVSYRCWPEERYVEIRNEIRRVAEPYGAQVDFPSEPFPAMVCPEKEGHALGRHLRSVFGPEAATELHAAIPFSGEDYALFLDRMPGTFTYLGVRSPGADITTCYPHLGGFVPDERAIGVGVRAMAGWLARRLR
ncbi:M20/M25/M40 family metallo-hydrolase [Actinomadura fulvescens]|uniref:M20 family metallopeptidase n=1 Tax=Actinomadura fulvescens TaxID=46160 RepID=A0ABN3QY00_9ACTN